MNAEKFCEPCQIVTTRACNCCKIPPSNPLERGHTIYMDILPPIPGLSSSTTFKFLLWLVDRTSRYAFTTGLHECTTEFVIDGINRFTAPTSHPLLIEFDIHRIKADAGTQFTSAEFQQACADSRISVSLVAPKHQEQNHFAQI